MKSLKEPQQDAIVADIELMTQHLSLKHLLLSGMFTESRGRFERETRVLPEQGDASRICRKCPNKRECCWMETGHPSGDNSSPGIAERQ